MSDSETIKKTKETSLDTQYFTNLEDALKHHNLPTDNIIANTKQRKKAMRELPELIESIPDDYKKDARYLSKFIASSSIGLFDASLNYMWDEVIINLRKKIEIYGLDYFYDVAISAKQRIYFSTVDDLRLVKDTQLLDSCRKLELISDILYRKLKYILDMRNQISVAHPNEYSISALELLSWLELCVNDLFLEKISEGALKVKALVDNLKNKTEKIDRPTAMHIKDGMRKLSPNSVSNLLQTLFGMFVSSETSEKNYQFNILVLSKLAWKYSTEKIKYSLGEKIDIYKTNLNTKKNQKAELFFSKMDGKKYYSMNSKTQLLTTLCDDLYDARFSWDNYIHEPPIAEQITELFDDIKDIPEIRIEKLITVFLLGRIGKNISYSDGISPRAKKHYDKLFSILDEKNIYITLQILQNDTTGDLLYGKYRRKHIISILKILKQKVLTDRCSELLDYLINFKGENFRQVFLTKKYSELKNGLF